MYIRANREKLIPTLAKVIGVVERRQTIPILGNILISAREDCLSVIGTDLEVEICAKTGINVEKKGEITLPARKTNDICRALPEGVEITLKVERERAVLIAGNSKFTLSTLPAKDFPVMEKSLGKESIEIENKTFRNLLEKTAFAMANQDVRYYLNGLLFVVKKDSLISVATDGHRLAKIEEKIYSKIENEMEIIIPRKTVLELNRILSGSKEEKIRLDISEKFICCYGSDTVLKSKLIDGKYPDYEKVIPSTPERVAVVKKEQLKQALYRTAILSNEKYRGVRVSVEEGSIKLQSHNPEQEEAEEEMEIKYDQEPTVMGFNAGYLIDVLNIIDEEEVEIGFRDSESSAILRSKGKEKETFVVMPMKI